MSEDIANGIKGALIGALLGAMAGLGACIWLISTPLFFMGDIVLIAAAVCGLIGFVFGDRFLDWLNEVWRV